MYINEMQKSWQLPMFSEQVLFPKHNKYCLVIPVINEGDRIKNQLMQMFNAGLMHKLDVIIADGNSTDNSLPNDMLKAYNIRALLVKTDKGKLSAQLRMAYAWALAQAYEGIITIDGNGKDSIESVPLFIKALDNGIDYAQASRFIKGGKGINTPLARLLAIRLIHAPVLSLIAKHWLTDTTQGFRAYSARYLLDERVKPFRNIFDSYELLAYLSVRASQLGYKVKEVPSTRSYPAHEPVPTKISMFSGNFKLLKILLETALRRYNP